MAGVPGPYEDDPGWRLSPALLRMAIPGLGLVRRRRPSEDGLLQLRETFVSFAAALVLFGVVLIFLYPEARDAAEHSPELGVGLVIAGVVAHAVGRVVERLLDCTSVETLAASYTTRFFLRIAFAESAALAGFTGFFVTNEWWTYPAGVAIAAVGFARAAPTRGNLAAEQDRLYGAGCNLSLVDALRRPLSRPKA